MLYPLGLVGTFTGTCPPSLNFESYFAIFSSKYATKAFELEVNPPLIWNLLWPVFQSIRTK